MMGCLLAQHAQYKCIISSKASYGIVGRDVQPMNHDLIWPSQQAKYNT